MQLNSPSVAEILAANGFDWIAIDAEHGEFSSHEYINIFRAVEKYNCSPFVRIPVGGIHEVKLALDSGARGIIVPMVESAKQLKEVIDFAMYPPKGKRGVGFSRANLFGKDFKSYVDSINDNVFIVAQIENISAVENINEILAVEGLSAIMVGPYDLSASMGLTAQFEHPDFLATLKKIKEACLKSRVQLGYHVVQPNKDELESKINEGYEFIAYGIDALFLSSSSICPKR